MSMLPNYVIAVLTTVFIIYSFVNIFIRKSKFRNDDSGFVGMIKFIISILIALLLLGMSIYGIIFNIPLSQVQVMIENFFR